MTGRYRSPEIFWKSLTILFLLSVAVSRASAQSDTLGTHRFFLTPLVTYSPETNWAFGAGAIYYLHNGLHYAETNPSLMRAFFVYTLNHQVESNLTGDIYLKNNLYYLSFAVSYYQFPDYFFGIGDFTKRSDREKYDFDYFYTRADAQKKLLTNFYGGFKTFFEYTHLEDTEPGGIFDTQDIPGEEGGINTGAGLWFTYDSRGNIYYPLQGWFIDLSSVLHTHVLGSNYQYVDNVIDIRKFINTYHAQVFAANLYFELQPGNPPFNEMARLGGEDRMRGNYEGRFRDRYYATLQAEYRLPVWKFIGSDFFAGLGEVAHTPDAFSAHGIKYSYGAGLRLNIVPGEKLNFRIDYGIGSDGDHGLYVQFNEAF